MTRLRRTSACAWALPLLAALLLAPGCTQWDDWLPGTPFTPDQPEGEVTLAGEMHIDPITVSGEGCAPGGTILWGLVRNTGDLDVTDVSISIDVFDGAGGFLGTYGGDVYNGEVETVELEDGSTIDIVGTSLTADPDGNGQSGSFNVCTPVPYGAAARTEYLTSFRIVETVE